MNSTLKNILVLIAALVIGGLVNMGIIMISGSVIAPPNGADVTTIEGLKESIHLFEPKHFLFPFLAHALGTLVGAFVVAKFAVTKQKMFAIIVGCFFLLGGITNSFMIPAPTWFIAVDLIGAYIPMALIGWKLAGSKT